VRKKLPADFSAQRPGTRIGARIGEGRQRVAEGRVEVHGAGLGPGGAFAGVRDRLAQVAEALQRGLRHGEFVMPHGVRAVEFLLVDGLAGGAFAQLGRAVGGDDDERRAAFARLDDRREIIRRRRAGGADERDGPGVPPGEAEREEARRAFVEHGDGFDAGVARKGERERRRARAGREHRVPHAAAMQRLGEHGAPEGVCVAEIER
jgi:hypothetical protein